MASVTPPHSTISVKSPAQEYKVSTGIKSHVIVDLVLRVLLLATALVGLIVMVTSKQTKMIPVAPGVAIPVAAKFSHSPAFIYYAAALSVACLYSILTIVLSVLLQVKPKGSSSKLLFHCVILDSLLLGIMASATGAAGAVAYIAYKGNSHTRWNEVCDLYASFCSHMAGSIVLSFLPPLTLLLLVWLSVFVLSKKIVR